MSYRVVLTDPDIHPPDEGVEAILRDCDATLDAKSCSSQEELLEFCSGADAVLCARAQITSAVIASMPHCRVIARLGTGYENVDCRAAGEAGVPVTNVPDFGTESVADHTMALMLACFRKLIQLDRQVRRGKWDPGQVMPTSEASGKSLGLVGFGKIGQAVAKRALGFGMRISYYDPAVSHHPAPEILACTSLEELLKDADIISLHVPLSEETEGLIGYEEFRFMKPTTIFVNCARGQVVVEEALYHALKDRLITAAALDVLESEPPSKDNPLFRLPNVIFSPHCAAHTVESLNELRCRAYEEVARALRREPLLSVVNQHYFRPLNNRSSS